MKVFSTPFDNVFLIEPNVHEDERGSFSERYNQKEFHQAIGKKIVFCQDNQANSVKGVIRGLHYQLPPFSQTKLVEVLQGSVLDIIVDIRKGSPTFGQYFSQELNNVNRLQLLIPRGFAHGYITLSERSIFQYKVDNAYHAESEGSIAPDDPSLGIDWKLPKSQWIQSQKDKQNPGINDASLFDFKADLKD